VALDGVGLLLFLVPGVIAFAVDFATGAIYLPSGYSLLSPTNPAELLQTRVNPAELTPQRLGTIIQEQTGQSVSLQPGTYRAQRLGKLDDITPETVSRLEGGPAPDRVIFRASAE
jgi:hypothetical protein